MRETRLRTIGRRALILTCILFTYAPGKAAFAGADTLSVSGPRVMVSPYHAADKDLVTAAVSAIGGGELDGLPGINRTNLLNGRVTGFLGIQNDGSLGFENNSMYVRGLRSLSSASQQSIIIVDGFYRRDAKSINPHDIESITVLKDAAATAMYGLKGGNGVILINTKRGSFLPPVVSYDANFGFQTPTRMPKYLGSYDFARLYNEASVNDGGIATYDEYDLEGYLAGDDPYKYPDNDFMNDFLKKRSFVHRHNVSVRGGSERVLYYASVGYVRNSGMFNVDKSANKYNTNADFESFLLRGNVDVNISQQFTMSVDINSQLANWNNPGAYSNSSGRVLNALAQTPPNAYAVFNEDSSLGGTSQYLNNPYGLLNKSGYSIFKNRTLEATMKLKHGLDFITRGLSVFGSLSFDNYFEQIINRDVGFVVFEGSSENERGTKDPAQMRNENEFQNNYRALDVRAGLDYSRSFGESTVSSMVFVNQNTESGDGRIMPRVYKSLTGYAHYNYRRRYIADFTFAYQGSEQIGGNSYNFFPSVSLGWVVSNESFMSGAGNPFSFMKLRASWGISGNDSNINYFQKSSFFSSIGSGYVHGESLTTKQGFRESQVGTGDIMAERSKKANIGLDIRMFRDRWSLSVDAFHENNEALITSNSKIPNIIGVRGSVKDNVGRMVNSGFEVATDFTAKAGKFGYSIYGNFSFARNIVKEMQETDALYRFNRRTGMPINSMFGLKSDGLFYDDADIAGHAVQTYAAKVQPGDIKYIDLNKDGIVNDEDRTYIGYSGIPEYVYGFGLNLDYAGFDLNVFFQGVGNVQTKMSGYVYWEFRPNGTGNVMEHHLDRWVYDPANGIDTRETATYPRLSLHGNDGNNNHTPNSDYWLRDASYLRLKSVELGYTLPARATKAIHMKNLRFYVAGTNLLTFDKVKILDPETTTGGVVYPLQRVLSLGLNISF